MKFTILWIIICVVLYCENAQEVLEFTATDLKTPNSKWFKFNSQGKVLWILVLKEKYSRFYSGTTQSQLTWNIL